MDDVSLASLDAGGTEDSGVLDSFVEDVVFPQAARLNAIAKHKKIAVSFFIMILPFLYESGLLFIAFMENFQILFMGHRLITALGNTTGISDFF